MPDLGKIKIGVDMDGTQFGNTLDEINRKLKQSESNMKAYAKGLSATGRDYDSLAQHSTNLQSVMTGEEAKIEELKKRRDKAIDQYGEESSQVANLNKQINTATGKYNQYSGQLSRVTKEMAYTKSGVNDITRAMHENEQQTKAEAAALRANGDELGALNVEQKGYEKQLELSEKAAEAQKQVVEDLSNEFGESSDEVNHAKSELDGFGRQTKIAKTQIEATEKAIQKAKVSFETLGKGINKAGKDIEKGGSYITSMGDGAKNIGSKLTSGITKPVLGISTALASFVGFKGFSRILDADAAEAKLRGLGYSTKDVGRITDQVAETTKTGMATMAEATDVAAGALAAGVKEGDDLQKYIKLVDSAATGAQRPIADMAQIFNKVQGQGKLMRNELDQIESGMPGFGQALADHLDVGYEELLQMVSDSEVTTQDFLKTMDSFAGGMSEAFAKSFKGMATYTVSYIGQIGEAFLNGGEDSQGFFDQLKPMLGELNDWLVDIRPKAEELGQQFGKSFAQMAEKIKAPIKAFTELDKAQQIAIGKLAGFGTLAAVALGPAMKVFGAIASPFGKSISAIGKGVQAGGGFLQSFGGKFEWLGNLLTPVTGFMKTFGSVVAGSLLLPFQKLGGVIGTLLGKIGPLGGWLSNLGTWIQLLGGEAFKVVKNFGLFSKVLAIISNPVTIAIAAVGTLVAAFSGLAGMSDNVTNKITNFLGNLVNQIPVFVEKAKSAISNFTQNLQESFQNNAPRIMNSLVNVMSSAITGITTLVPRIVQAANVLISGAVNTFSAKVPQFMSMGIRLIGSLANGLLQMLPTIINSGAKLITSLVTGLVQNLPKIISMGVRLVKTLGSGLVKTLPTLAKSAIKIISTLASGILDNLPRIIKAGISLVNSLISGISNNLPKIISAGLTLVIKLAAGLIKNLPKIIATGIQIIGALISGLVEAIPKLAKMVPQIKDAIFDTLKDFDWGKLGKDILNGIIKGLVNIGNSVKDAVKDVGGKIKDGFKDFFDIHSPSRVMADIAKEIPAGIAQGIVDGGAEAANSMAALSQQIMDNAPKQVDIDVVTKATETAERDTTNGNENNQETPEVADPEKFIADNNAVFENNNAMMQSYGVSWMQNFLTGFSSLYQYGIAQIKTFVVTANRSISSNNKQMVVLGRSWLQNFINGFNSQYKNTVSRVRTLISEINKLIRNNNRLMTNQGKAWLNSFLKGFNSVYGKMTNRIKNLVADTNKIIRNNNRPMQRSGREWLSQFYNGFNSLFQKFVSLVDKLGKQSIQNLRKKQKDFKSAGKFLMEGLISGINSMGNQLAKTMNGVANKMVSGINKGIKGVRSGVNHILKEVDSDKRIKEWNPPKYARGTSRRGHPEDGPAIINDAKGPKYKEIVQKRDGSMWTTDAKNAMAYLNKGDRVINGKLSDRMLNQKHVPHYAKGTDPDEDQDMEEIFDIIDDKKKYKEFLQNKINYDGLNSPWLNMTKSASKMMINEAYDMIQKESEAMMGGSFDGDIWNKGPDTANGVYSYLVKIAKNVIKKFPGMSITSGYRPNDPHHHGKRQAIDIAYGAGLNGSKKYIAPANYAFKKFRDQIAYVIALNKVKDRTGYAGEGKTNSWKPFRGGGHMDHLHLSGLFGPGDVGKGDSESLGGGSGVNRWKKTAMKALRMEGLYSKKNLSLLMMQMKSESNGNPKAINNWDANAKRGTPSKGLMQVIGPTFQSNKRKGYGNIWKPLDNILAAIRYTKKQYGSLSRGWRDSGYENGGLVSKDGLYRMGEKNRKEMVIPLHRAKRSRAMELLEKTKTALGDEEKNVTVVSSGGDMSGVESKLDTLIGLMSALLEKDSNTYLDGRAVEKQLSKVSKQREKMSQRKRGKNVTFA